MPSFQYKAINASGARVSGIIDCPAAPAVVEALLKQGLHAMEVREASGGALSVGGGGLALRRKVPLLELALFLRQLSTLINSDVPLAQSLAILEGQTGNPTLRGVIGAVRSDVQGGADFSTALSRWPRAFTPLVISMARVGETGGALGKILEELAIITERDQQTRSEVRTAMVYPVVVVFVGVLVVSILMTMVVPKLAGVFSDMGSTLPWPTRVLMATSGVAKTYWPALPIGLILLVTFYRGWRAAPEGRLQSDALLLRLPVFGDLARKSSVSRFSRALGALLGGGVPLLEALNVVKGVLDNAALGKAIDDASAGLREGGSLGNELQKSGLFPDMVTHMIRVGENSGNLDKMLLRVAETYEWQTQQAVRTMLALLSPAMILCLAVVVGFIALALVYPLYSMRAH